VLGTWLVVTAALIILYLYFNLQVPYDKPKEALEMVNKWLEEKDF